MNKTDIKEAFKFARTVIAGLIIGSVCAFLIGIVLGLIWRLFAPPENRPECPICGKHCATIYQNIDTGEIIGCDYCVIKGDIYDGENKTN